VLNPQTSTHEKNVCTDEITKRKARNPHEQNGHHDQITHKTKSTSHPPHYFPFPASENSIKPSHGYQRRG